MHGQQVVRQNNYQEERRVDNRVNIGYVEAHLGKMICVTLWRTPNINTNGSTELSRCGACNGSDLDFESLLYIIFAGPLLCQIFAEFWWISFVLCIKYVSSIA